MNTPLKAVIGNTLAAAGLGGVLAGFVFPKSSIGSWGQAWGFALVGVPFLIGLFPFGPRRRQVATGTYFLVTGADFESKQWWPSAPAWFAAARATVFIIAAGWFIYELSRKPASSPAP